MQENEQEFSFKSLFIPLTTLKAIHWIIFIGLIVYANMLFNGFVWDDKTYITFNTDVQSFNLWTLLKNNIFNAGGQYRPIPGIYFAASFAIFKDSTFFYHFIQLLIHIVNTSLLFIIFTKFFGKKISLILSSVFLVHPSQVESVSYIAATGNPLFFLFGMVALILSLRNKISMRRSIVIAIFLLLSLLTKEAGLLFIFIVLLYRFIFKRKTIFILFFAESLSLLVYFVIRFGIGGVYFTKLPLIPIARLPVSERLMHVPAIIFYYLKTFFLPIKLAVDQQWIITSINFQSFYFPLFMDVIFFLMVSLLGIYIYRNNKNIFNAYLFFLVWFVAGLSLYLQIFPLDGTVADRWFYFPIVGLLGLFGTFLIVVKSRFKSLVNIWYIIVVLLILLSFRTIARNANWYSPIVLYTNDIQILDNFDIENTLGTEYANVGDYKNAVEHLHKSVDMFSYEANLYNLGNTYEQWGDKQSALKYYSEALNSKNYLPIHHRHFPVTYIRLAYMLYLNGSYENAKTVIKNGLQDYPDSGYLLIVLAACENKLNNQKNALSAIENAKRQLSSEQISNYYKQIMHDKLLVL